MSESWRDWDCLDIGLRVLVARRQFMTTWTFADLAAPHWRLYAMQEAGAWVRVGRRRLELDPGSLWLVPPETSFHSGTSRPVMQTYVHFLIRPAWRGDRRDFHPVPMDTELRRQMREMEQPSEPWRGSCLLHQWILAVLARLPPDGFEPPGRDPRLRHLLGQITAEPSRPWTNREMAGAVGMHPHALVRWFRHHTGRTPRAFVIERRVQEACLRLHHSDESVEAIAAATGFCDRYHLSRAFKKHRGEGPAAFRRKWAGLPASRRTNDWVAVG